MEWFRWYGGTFNDPKLQWVARQTCSNVAAVLAVWVAVLERAHEAENRGCCEGIDFESMDVVLGLDDGSTHDIYQAMIKKQMIVDGNKVAAWDKRQPKREDDGAAERQKNKREKDKLINEIAELKKQLIENMSRTVTDVTQCHAMSRHVTTDKSRLEEIREEEPLKPKAKMMMITDVRFLHSSAFGIQFPPGANNLAVEICQRFSADAITSAFETAAVHNKPSMAYVLGVLNGNGKPKSVLSENQRTRGRPVTFAEATTMANEEASQEVLRRLTDATTHSAGVTVTGGFGFQVGGNDGCCHVTDTPNGLPGGVG